MKKSRILGYALTLAATLVVGGTMGQTAVTSANFVKVGSDADGGDAENYVSYVTVNKEMLYRVSPDLAFHPAYNAVAGTGLTANTVWKWTLPANITGAIANGVESPSGPTDTYTNENKLKATVAGVYDISVVEKTPGAINVCSGTARSFKIIAFAEPTISVTSGGRTIDSDCTPVTGWNVVLNTSASDKVRFTYTLEVFPVTFTAGAWTPGTAHNTYPITSTSLSSGNTYVAANDGTWTLEASKPFVAITKDATNTIDNLAAATKANVARNLTLTRDYPVVTGDNVTLYRYTFKGINDFVTRKCDYPLAGSATTPTFTWYDNTDKVVDIYVKRAPKTGPVYHINNNIAI